MKKVISGVAMLAALLTITAVAPAEAGSICLSTRNIQDTTPQKDGTAILF